MGWSETFPETEVDEAEAKGDEEEGQNFSRAHVGLLMDVCGAAG